MGRGPIRVNTKPKPAGVGRGRGQIRGGKGGGKKGTGGGRGSGLGGSNSAVMNRLGGGQRGGGGRGSGGSSSSSNRPTETYQNLSLTRGNHYTKGPQKADGPGNYDAPGSPLAAGTSPRNSGGASTSTSQQPPTNQAMDGQYTPAPAAPNHGQMGANGHQYHAPPVVGPAAGGNAPPPPPAGGNNNPPPPGGNNNPPPGGNNNPPPNNNQGNQPGQLFGGLQVQNPPPPPSRAARLLRKIKPESKKGYATYGALALLVAGGATTPLWLPAIKEATDDNGSSTPDADGTRVIGKRTNGKNQAVTGIDLTKLVSPADAEPGSQIDPSSFLLFKSLEISEPGAKKIEVNGKWAVTNAGILSFTPDQNADFGSVTIAYTVQDKLGRTSEYAEVQIVYGPLVDDIERMDLAPDKKTPAISISDVYKPASDAAQSQLDPASVKLVRRLDGIETIQDSVTIEDGSVWRAENGKVTFEPSVTFVSTNVNIGFVVRDKEGLLSNEGQIALFFKPKAMTQEPIPGTDPEKPRLAFAPEIAVNTENARFVLASTVKLKASSVEIAMSPTGEFGKSIDAGREGSWSVSGNAINYTRGAGFREAPTAIFYRAVSDAGVASDVFAMAVGIFPPPRALDVTKQGLRAVIDVLPSTRIAYTLENNAIDEESLRFLAVAPDDPSDPTPVLSNDGKTADVRDEGTWTVIAKNSKVKFTPVRGFNRQPTPMFYTVRDTKGSESNPAKIVVSKAAEDVRKMIADMMALTQAQFASRLKSVMAGKPLSDALVVCFQLRNLFYSQMNEAQRMDIRTAPGISEQEQDRIFNAWMEAGFDFATLVDETENVRQMTLGLRVPRNNLGARVLRLEEIMRALDKYFDALEAAM